MPTKKTGEKDKYSKNIIQLNPKKYIHCRYCARTLEIPPMLLKGNIKISGEGGINLSCKCGGSTKVDPGIL